MSREYTYTIGPGIADLAVHDGDGELVGAYPVIALHEADSIPGSRVLAVTEEGLGWYPVGGGTWTGGVVRRYSVVPAGSSAPRAAAGAEKELAAELARRVLAALGQEAREWAGQHAGGAFLIARALVAGVAQDLGIGVSL